MDMEYLHNGYTLQLCHGAFPLSTDSIALAAFARLPKEARVLDLGSGCGTLGLLLLASDPGCTVTGVELDENAHNMALQNARDNHISNRLTSICGDIAAIHTWMQPGSFSCCISNPPYFSAGPKSQTVPNARNDELCSLDTLMKSAAWALKYGGDFFLVHKPERLSELCATATKYGLEPKRLQLLRHRENSPVSVVLLACRKGAKPGLVWEELCLYDKNDQPTADYRRLYHQEVI